MTEDLSMRRGKALGAMLRGAALVAILLWSVMSFLPLVSLIFDDLSAWAVTVELFFLATGAVGLPPVYLVYLYITPPDARRRFALTSRQAVDRLGLFAAGWILLYSAVA